MTWRSRAPPPNRAGHRDRNQRCPLQSDGRFPRRLGSPFTKPLRGADSKLCEYVSTSLGPRWASSPQVSSCSLDKVAAWARGRTLISVPSPSTDSHCPGDCRARPCWAAASSLLENATACVWPQLKPNGGSVAPPWWRDDPGAWGVCWAPRVGLPGQPGPGAGSGSFPCSSRVSGQHCPGLGRASLNKVFVFAQEVAGGQEAAGLA